MIALIDQQMTTGSPASALAILTVAFVLYPGLRPGVRLALVIAGSLATIATVLGLLGI